VRNYMTKFLDDGWMRQHGFAQADWELGTVADLLRTLPRRNVIPAEAGEHLEAALEKFKQHGISQMPVLEHGRLAGMLTETNVLRQLASGRATPDTAVAEIMERRVAKLQPQASAGEVAPIFERGEVVLVVDEQDRVLNLITKMDLIEILAARRRGAAS
jgi:cystathionine beta-synthase